MTPWDGEIEVALSVAGGDDVIIEVIMVHVPSTISGEIGFTLVDPLPIILCAGQSGLRFRHSPLENEGVHSEVVTVNLFTAGGAIARTILYAAR